MSREPRRHAGAREVVDAVLDQGSYSSWDGPPSDPPGAGEEYLAELRQAASQAGVDEALVTGEGMVGGRRVAVAAGEFRFLGGSIGVAAGSRLVAALERATRERLPFLAAPASGGTRMQEGTVAFLQMVKISAAVAQHKAAGLPYLVYLRHPTTGGVLASWGSLGHVTAAEPGALVGFLGPRVHQALYGTRMPPEVQRSENLEAHGLIDAVVPLEGLAAFLVRVLAVLAPIPNGAAAPVDDVAPVAVADIDAWESVTRSRRPDRPGARALLATAACDVVPLRATGGDDPEPGMVVALARVAGVPCVVTAEDWRGTAPRALDPRALRESRRGMRLAAQLGIPLVTVVDTTGVVLDRTAEEHGLAMEIAHCLADMIVLPSPTVCVLLGQGGGGPALALLPADRVICALHAWLSPLPPEGSSAIVHGDTASAADMARRQGVRSRDLLGAGIVDRIVEERPDAADEPEDFLRRVGAAVGAEVRALAQLDPAERLAARLARYRGLGEPPPAPPGTGG